MMWKSGTFLEKFFKSEKMKNIKILLILFLFSPLFAVDNQKLLDCYKIFEQKRAELEAKAEALLEKQEAFESLKNTYMALMKKKEKELKLKEQELNATLAIIKEKQKKIQELVKKNEEILKAIKEAKLDKLTESYAKMRPKNAAQILEDMKPKDAIEILQRLSPRVLSKILAKMDPAKAAMYTQMLQKDTNESTNTSDSGGS